jgi:hypothetical protein
VTGEEVLREAETWAAAGQGDHTPE